MITIFDYIVIAAFFAFLLGSGWYFRRFSKDSSQYFRGGGRMAWWLVGCSAFMSAFSAWTFTGAAGQAYEHGLVVLTIYWAGALAFLVNAGCTAAWFRQTRVITSMEAIRARLGPANEQFYTWLALPIGIIVAGIWLYGLSVFCAPVFGFNLQAMILICGIAVVLMTASGGQWAIVATDFMQALMLIPIAIVAAVAAWFSVGGWSGLRETLPATHWDLSASASVSFGKLWVVAVLLEKFFVQNALHGAGRYLNVRDGREAKKAALLATLLFGGASFLWFLPPLAARAQGLDLAALFPGLTKPSEAAYVAVASRVLPAGLMGLMITGIIAATLSSMDAGLNRNAGIFVRSVYMPLLRPRAGDREQVLAGRIATLAFGAIVILTALLYSTWKDLGVFDLMFGFSALMGIPYAVAATWCLFIKRVPDWAAWSTVLVGMGVGAAISGAPRLLGGLVTEGSAWAGRLAWMGDHHFISVTLGGVAVSSLWFFGVAKLFGPRIRPERMAEIENFFSTMRRPVEAAAESVEQVNTRGTQGIGRLCLLYGGFIMLLALIPNGLVGRLEILFCALFIAGIGFALTRVGRAR
ncbi:hypothetical protein OH491_01895 [Termitidicoccus mucosus]|uniref:Transporter n=1 Tax=Termitidicoccus mucosus TaxID=1184151 RepID=A0A178ILG9_9BACT|nr:hypothetical protein AW736_07660 [Opitutaceae bacterium TSB47]